MTDWEHNDDSFDSIVQLIDGQDGGEPTRRIVWKLPLADAPWSSWIVDGLPIELNLSFNPHVTDESLRELSRDLHLEALELSGTAITDRGLEILAEIGVPATLELSFTAITDRGLEALRGAPVLEHLYLYQTDVTDAGLAALAGIPRLQGLGIDGPCISNRGVQRLPALSRLTQLSLLDAAVTDDAMTAIGSLASLEHLNVSGCDGLTDAGLPELARLSNLRSLLAVATGITPDGVADHLHAIESLQVCWVAPAEGGSV